MAAILLLEPDMVLAQTYQAALEQAGHQVWWRQEAQTALDVLDDQPIDLIILELQLADHNGVEFLHEIRSYPDWDELPVLLHSSLPQVPASLGQKFWPQLGIAGYLYKPHASLARLRQTVDQLVTQQA